MKSMLQTGGNQALKVPPQYALNGFVGARVAALAAAIGHGLPCKITEVLIGPLVTVSFQANSIWNLPSITMPVAGSTQYARPPYQVGDQGLAMPADVALANITGQSKAVPSFLGRGTTDGNLATLAFHPLSGPAWPQINNGNAWVIYGVSGGGVVLQDSATGSKTTLNLTDAGITITANNGTGTIAITGNLTATGGITAGFGTGDSVTLQHHEHPTAPSGPVSPPMPGT